MKTNIEYLKGNMSFGKIQALGLDNVNISINDNLGTRAAVEYCYEGNDKTYTYLKENSSAKEPIAIVLEKDLKYLMNKAEKLDSLIRMFRDYEWDKRIEELLLEDPKSDNGSAAKKKPTVADMMYGHEGEYFTYYPEGATTPERVILDGFAVRDGNTFIISTRLYSTGDTVWFFEDGRYCDMNDSDYDGKECALFPLHMVHWDIYSHALKSQPERGEDVYAGKYNKKDYLMSAKYIRYGIVEGVEDSEGYLWSSDVVFSKKEIDEGTQLLTNYGSDKLKVMNRPE